MPEFEFSFEKELTTIKAIVVTTFRLGLVGIVTSLLMIQNNKNKIKGIDEQQKVLLQKIQDNNDEMRSSFKSLSRDVDKLGENVVDMPYYISRAKEIEDLCKTPQNQKYFGSTEDCVLYMKSR